MYIGFMDDPRIGARPRMAVLLPEGVGEKQEEN